MELRLARGEWLGSSLRERYFTGVLVLFVLSFVAFPTSKSVNNFYYLLLGVPALACFVQSRGDCTRGTPLTLVWSAFLVLQAGIAAWQGQWKHLLTLMSVATFVGLLACLVSVEVFRNGRFARGLFWVLAVYLLGVAAVYWGTGRYEPGDRVLEFPGRLNGPILSSMWLVCLFALSARSWISERRWLEAGAGLLATLFIVGYVLQSRSGLLGLGVLALVGFALALVRDRRAALTALGGIAVLGIGAVLVLARNEVFVQLFERGDSFRLELWPAYLSRWTECGLWLGCGLDWVNDVVVGENFKIMHTHNIFLSFGLYTGLVVLVPFLVLMAMTLHSAWQARDPWGLYLFLALAMLNFDGGRLITSPNELWLLVLLPSGLIAAGYRRRAGLGDQRTRDLQAGSIWSHSRSSG